MSLQTGVETPSGPASRRIADRVRFRVDLATSQPNPLWVREMRQSARLLRTPIILMVITVVVTMLMAAIGGISSGTGTSPAEAGTILFHLYFSLAWFVVTLMGPALAANSIASEREGKTWEAVLLTGMRPSEVARGKFFSAYTAIAMYIVMLAPVGALPFLFGGITPIEVLVAFLFLFLIALLSVAFGLAISAKMESLRGALLVTLLVAAPLSLFIFLIFGVAGATIMHDMWDAVERGWPVWLPTAYGRAPFGIEYVVYLMVIPAALVCLPAWLLYEITRSNLTSVTDDRTYGLKKWFLVASLVGAGTACIPLFAVHARDRATALIIGACLYGLFVIFNAFLFAGEPIGPSRRVKMMVHGASAFRRLLVPGVMRTALMQAGVAIVALGLLCVAGVTFVTLQGGPFAELQTEQLITFTAYAIGFLAFVIGLAAFLRARATTMAVPRVLLLVILFFLFTGPWIAAAITGMLSSTSNSYGMGMAVAAPSPFYLIIAVEALGRPDPGVAVTAAMVAAGVYALTGFTLLIAAHVRCKGIIDDHERVLAEADKRLAEEDTFAAREREAAEQENLADLEQPPEEAAPADAPALGPDAPVAEAPVAEAPVAEAPVVGAVDGEPAKET